ncbi:prephenate dehydratase domain-containing protein [Pseudomonas aeruginosa]
MDSHYPGVERVAVSSNADAASEVKSEWRFGGDRRRRWRPALYDLSKLREKIEDRPDNSTRFDHRQPGGAADRRRQDLDHRFHAQQAGSPASCWYRS